MRLEPQNSKYKNALAVAYNNLGLKLNKDGNYRDGLSFLSKALGLDSDDKDVRSNLTHSVFEAMKQRRKRFLFRTRSNLSTR